MPLDETEHERLLQITAEIEQEHERLKETPNDVDAHAAHRANRDTTSKTGRRTFSD